MARAALPGRLTWQLGKVLEAVEETPRVKSIVLEVPQWAGHRAGQHVDVRLTAEDGYQAQRSYSIASAPDDQQLMLTVERIEDGEVSPYLIDDLLPGDELELRGPIGGYFVWEPSDPRPVVMLAGGSGVVPFRSMLRAWSVGPRTSVPRLLYSSRSLDEVIYREELRRLEAEHGVDVRFALTRAWPEQWSGHRGRVDRELLEAVAWPASAEPVAFVCGPNGFVETVGTALVALGYGPRQVRTERFGPSGTPTA